MSFWHNCEHLMVEYDLTQEAFGRIVGVSPATVNRWKKGSIPRVNVLVRICDEFNVTRDDLLSGDLAMGNKTDKWSELCYYYVMLDDDGREALLTVAKQMAVGK